MRYDKGHKATTRQRIVEVAAARFKEHGVASVGIAGLMADAGLTHGGFYAHFASKEDLLREALVASGAATQARLARAAAQDGAGLEGLVRRYLRAQHRDMPAEGCAIAALAPDIARQSLELRTGFTERLEAFLGLIKEYLPAGDPAAQKAAAIGILGVMLGTLQLSRAVVDPVLSDEILENGIQAALRLGRILDGYAAMAADEVREAEAMEWIEGFIEDVAEEAVGGR